MGKADNLMLGLNTLAGGKEGGELFLTVKSIRELAEDFDKRSGALMTDGRRTLGDISRAVNNLDRNPTRLLFGAGNSSSRAGGSAAGQAGPRGGAARRSGRKRRFECSRQRRDAIVASQRVARIAPDGRLREARPCGRSDPCGSKEAWIASSLRSSQ